VEHAARDRAVDDQAAHTDEGGDEGHGRTRRVEAAAAQGERDELSIGECYNPYMSRETGHAGGTDAHDSRYQGRVR